MIETILVATDASNHAKAAVDFGAAVAAKYDAKLVLLHVTFGSDLPDELYQSAKARFEELEGAGKRPTHYPEWARGHQIEEFAGRMVLDEAKARTEEWGARNVETVSDFGSTSERIIEHAKTLPADLIVMGTRGHSELRDFVLGGASHAVQHYAPCTCVTVHDSGRGTFEGLKRILVPTDGSKPANGAVAFASDVAAKFGAELVLLHVLMRRARLDRVRESMDPDALSESTRKALRAGDRGLPLLSAALSEDALREIGEQVLETAKRTAGEHGAESVTARLVDGSPAETVLKTAADEAVDMIAMGTRGLSQAERLFLGSVSSKVSRAAACTTMIVR